MRPLPHAMLLLVAAAFATPTLRAQVPDSAATSTPSVSASPSDGTSPLLNPPASASASTPAHARPMSPAIAARIAEKMPPFAPQSAPASFTESVTVNPVTLSPDPRETDKPRNTIIRLPSYLVQEDKPPVFKERELLTPRGKLALGLKRYPGLKFGNIWFLRNDGWALAMLEEDFALERKAEMTNLVSLISSPTERAKAKDEAQKTFLRPGW
jgi:hypothetical protein